MLVGKVDLEIPAGSLSGKVDQSCFLHDADLLRLTATVRDTVRETSTGARIAAGVAPLQALEKEAGDESSGVSSHNTTMGGGFTSGVSAPVRSTT